MPEIVHICYPGIGGQASVAVGLAQEGMAAGISQAIIFYGVEPPAPQYLKLCQSARIPTISIIKKPGLGLRARRKLSRSLRELAPATVVANNHDTAITTSCCRFHGYATKTILVEHHSNALKTRKEWVLSGLAHRLADHTVYLTQAYQSAVKEKLGRHYFAAKTSVIANGIDLSLYRPCSDDCRASDDPCLVIGMQGRMAAGKDFETLLQAFARVIDTSSTPIFLELVGDGPDRGDLENLASQLKISKYVRFLGFIPHDQLIERMKNWNIAVLSTMGETLSIAILEAWALSLPLIGSRVSGVKELINHDQDGLLVEPSDVVSLLDAMNELIANNQQRRMLGDAGRRRIEDSYTRKASWDRYHQLSQRLLSRSVFEHENPVESKII